MAIIDATPLDRMTLAELMAERARWDRLMETAIGLAIYEAAADCRAACDQDLARRARAGMGAAA